MKEKKKKKIKMKNMRRKNLNRSSKILLIRYQWNSQTQLSFFQNLSRESCKKESSQQKQFTLCIKSRSKSNNGIRTEDKISDNVQCKIQNKTKKSFFLKS